MVQGTDTAGRRKVISFVVAAVVAVVLIGVVRACTSGDDDAGDAGQPLKCSGDSTQLHVTSSPEKFGLMQQVAREYSGRTVAGKCADVVVSTKSSGEAMANLADGWNEAASGPRPDVWSPAGSAWVTLLKQRATKNDKPSVLTDAKAEPIVNAPLVIAMPKPMAEALGWPDKSIGWKDLSALAVDPQGWSRYNHPEWGKFRLGKTNPNLSTSGLNATIGSYQAATGVTSDLTAANLADPKVQAFVGGVEQSIEHYGDTTLTFLSNLQQADDRGAALSYISAVAVEENSLVAYNQGNPTGDPATLGKHAKPKVPLAAIYPSDGTLMSDHPFVVLNTADEARKQVAADFLAYLHSDPVQATFADQGFRSYRNVAGGQVTKDNGALPDTKLTVLSPPNPTVLDGVLQSWAQLRKKANVLLVVDVSGSMGAPVEGTGKTKMDLAKSAAVEALGQFGDQDKVGLWMFSTGLDGDRDYQELAPVAPVGGQRDVLKSRLEGLTPNGGTGLYDVSLASFKQMQSIRDPKSINAVVVLTDGRNEDGNGVSLDNLLPQLTVEDSGESVHMFTIAYGGDADQDVLRQIAQATNGAEYDSSKPDTIDKVFTAVISNF